MIIAKPGKRIPIFLNIFKKITIRQRITLIVVLLVLLPMLFAGVYFNINTSSILTSNAKNQLDQMVEQTSDNINTAFDNISNTSVSLMSSPTVSNKLQSNENNKESYTRLLESSEIEAEFDTELRFNYAWESNLLFSVYLFTDESNFYSLNRLSYSVQTLNGNNLKIYKQMGSYAGREILLIPPTYNDQTIYFARNEFNINTVRISAKLILGMDEKILSQKYDAVLQKFPGSKVFIFNKDGIIFSNQDKNKLGKKMDSIFLSIGNTGDTKEININKQMYYIATREIYNNNLTLLIGIPKTEVLSKLSASVSNYLLISLIIVFISIIVSVFVSLSFTNFIKDILSNIREIGSGNYDAKMPVYNDNELNQLSSTFNKMTGEIKYLIDQVYEKQLLVKESEYKFLQSQMNPHFLFNILATIGWKAKLCNDETIYRMVSSLSELLQASIYSDNKTKILIREEIEYVEFYLYLQKARFENKIDYRINVFDADLLDCYLPKLSIEPIVENAVVHGLEKKIGNGLIQINIKKDNDSVYIEIIDDGLGFDMDQSKILDSGCENKKKKGHSNIGLNNTNKRIKLLYGDQYGISIESKMNIGFKVVVHIPVDKGDALNV